LSLQLANSCRRAIAAQRVVALSARDFVVARSAVNLVVTVLALGWSLPRPKIVGVKVPLRSSPPASIIVLVMRQGRVDRPKSMWSPPYRN
jgi:hypothetical protein